MESWSEKQPAPLKEPRRAARAGAGIRHAEDPWSRALEQDWRSLLLVPADPGSSAVEAARALAHAGQLQLIAAKGIDSLTSQMIAREIPGYAKRGRLVIAIDPVVSDPAGIELTRHVDAVVLCITMGRTELSSARKTLRMIGRRRFIGCVTLSS